MALRAGGEAARVPGPDKGVGGREGLRVARPRPTRQGLRASAGDGGAVIHWAMSHLMLRRLADAAR